MTDTSPALRKNDYLLITALLNFFVLLVLYQFRAIDDNRLTSWEWVFDGANVPIFFLLIAAGILTAYLLSKITLAGRGRFFFLFVSSFLICTFFFEEPEVIVDASRYFAQAKHLEIYGLSDFINEWGRGIEAWTDLPLVPLIYGLIFKFLGESRLFIQILNSLFFSSSILLTCHIGRLLWDEDIGFAAGVLLMGIPYVFTQVPLMLVDIPAMFFLTLSVFAFLKAVRQGRGWVFFSAVSIVFAILSKYSTWMMLSVIGVIFFVCLMEGAVQRGGVTRVVTRKEIILRAATVLLLSGLLTAIIFWKDRDLILGQIRLLQEYQQPGLSRWGESYISTFFFQIHPFISIAALYSLFAALRKKDLKYLVISFLVILFMAMQIRRIRYMLPIFPMITLMASYGLHAVKDKDVRRFAVSSVVLSSIVLSLFIYLPFLKRMSAVNLMDAGRFLDTADIGKVVVLTVPSERVAINPAVSVPLLDIFTDRKLDFEYTPEKISLDRIKESSLRFTWRYRNPEYYAVNDTYDNGGSMLVVISSEYGQAIPENIRAMTEGRSLVRIFNKSTGVFNYITEVKIYR